MPAQLHFIQRFGGSLNLHIHVHAVVSDGVFNLKTNMFGRRELAFTPVACPTAEQLAAIVTAVRKKLIRRICRTSGLSREAAADLLAWRNSGFSIHKEVNINAGDRKGLEHLVLRAPGAFAAKTCLLRENQYGYLPHSAQGGEIGDLSNVAH